MIRNSIPLNLLLLIFLTACFLNGFSQTEEMQRLASDFPALTKEYPVDKQSATYVFAIDFSSSMKPLEPMVKRNIELFINSLPDGDHITLIKEGETANTGSIYLENAVISSQSRIAIINRLTTSQFNENGSDGYKMAEKVIEAIDQTGGNELNYIFYFTDFEYYTQENGYNKDRCEWSKLKSKYAGIQQGKRIIKIGLELPADNLRQGAIYKSDLNSVFDGVKYYQILDGGSLSNWFADTRANILRDRLKYLIEKKVEMEVKLAHFHMRPTRDAKPTCWIKCDNCQLLQSFSFIGPDELRKAHRPLIEWPFARNTLKTGEIKLIFNEKYVHSKGYNEVEKLMPEMQERTVTITLHQPEAYLSWWLALLIIFVLLAILVCLAVTCLSKRTFTSLRANADWTFNHKYESSAKTFASINRLVIGSANNSKGLNIFNVPDVSKQIEILYRHSCPCRLWIKSGVYIRANQGNNIKFTPMGKKEVHVLMSGSMEFIAPLKNFMGVLIEFEENSIAYTIKVRK